jgi:hypothetical protein
LKEITPLETALGQPATLSNQTIPCGTPVTAIGKLGKNTSQRAQHDRWQIYKER